MKAKATFLATAVFAGAFLALGVAAYDGNPSTQPAVDPIGAGLAKLIATENPAVGTNVSVRMEEPVANGDVGTWTGRLVSINDHWAVVDTDFNQGTAWIPLAKIKYIRINPKQ